MDSIDHLNEALEGRYRIEREIGEGGMATVYLADDLRHERHVALKVLKPELAAVLGAARFLAEIKTTAGLQHPHILPLFDSGEADGLLYYTMPYVEGETLRGRLERESRLPVEEAVGIATDVAEALQVAHEHGIIHRDIKPSNILLSRGKALVADFGIARAAELSGDTRFTQTGSSLGTVGYMSPEQASGDRDIDPRADIYSLGCVLFEMLTGRRPYDGPSLMSVLAKQATDPVPSVRALRPETPVGLDRAVVTSLAKEPAGRFESAAAFVSALRSREAATVPPAPVGNVILVLPFVNRSPDPDNEYFSDGLTDEVISDLAGVSALRIISRNSAMALKGTTKDTPTLARELGVTHLVTGTVRRVGDALRVTADLVEGSSDRPIWSQKFSGTMEDVFGIQEEISRQIVSALEVELTEKEEREVAEHPIDDPVAYDCYLRAYQLMYNWTPEDQHRALVLVDDAIGIVGDSALLLATKGWIHWSQVNMFVAPAEEGLARASDLTDRALALDPDHPVAIYVRGLIAGMRGRPEAALVDLHRAHRLRPGDSIVVGELHRYSQSSGLHCRKYVDQMVRLDPLTPITHVAVSTNRWLEGPIEETAAAARHAIALAPEVSMMHVYLGWHLAEAGSREEAAEILGRVGPALAGNVHGELALFLARALEGDEEEAVRIATPAMEATVQNEMAARIMAAGWAVLGRKRDAIRVLRRAVELGFINYPNLSEGAAVFDSLRAEPEFQALLAEVKPRWESVLEWERGLVP